MNRTPFSQRICLAIIAITTLAAGPSLSQERAPRIVFNDDAQMLSEAPWMEELEVVVAEKVDAP